MKKLLLVILFILTPVSMIYAESSVDDTQRIEEIRNQIATLQEELAELEGENESNSIGNEAFEFSFDWSIEESVSAYGGFGSWSPDGVYLVVKVNYKNISKESQQLDGGAFDLVLDDVTYNGSLLLGESIAFDSVNPGNEKEEYLLFDVPLNVAKAEGLILKYSPSFISSGEGFEYELSD